MMSGVWRITSQPRDYRRFAWDGGVFESARRSYTDVVEGTVRSPHHLVMVTLRGGARRHQMRTDCGHRYDGPDRAGYASFLPAHRERRLKIEGVAWEWASLALPPDLFEGEDGGPGHDGIVPFSNVNDAFLVSLLSELERIHAIDGRLDPAYCDAMSLALVHYLQRRYGGRDESLSAMKLPPWRLRRIAEYVEARLDGDIRIHALASLVGLSEGHLQRAFRLTTGRSPLQFINEMRISRAMKILSETALPVSSIALEVGFVSPSHFARVFRAVTGVGPAQYRKDHGRSRRAARVS
jgi:AraC family transcriptional regulator